MILVCFVMLVFLLASQGCDCGGVPIGGSSILVAKPKTLTFATVVGRAQTKAVKIVAESGSISITKIEIAQGDAHYELIKASVPSLPKSLDSGESFSLQIKFVAPKGTTPLGILRLESNAIVPKGGVLEVRLLAGANHHQLVFEPNPVDFGVVKVGESKDITVVGWNKGSSPLSIQTMVWETSSSQAFLFLNGLPKAPKTIEPGGSFHFKVRYSPASQHIDKGVLRLICEGNCAPSSPLPSRRKDPYLLQFRGALAVPILEVKPISLDFGAQVKGSRTRRTFQVTNKGVIPLHIKTLQSKAGSSGSFVVPFLQDLKLASQKSETISVEYRPVSGSKHTGTVEIKSNDPNRPKVDVLLTGRIAGPDIEVSPKELNFGVVPPSKTLDLKIANVGNKPLTISGIKLTQGSAREIKVNTKGVKFPQIMQPNQVLSVAVAYAPFNKGKETGVLEIASDDPDEAIVKVPIRGENTSASSCRLEASPRQIAFGHHIVGTSKEVQTTWSNKGTRSCFVSQINVITDGFFGLPSGTDAFVLPSPPKGCVHSSRQQYTCQPPLEIAPGSQWKQNVAFAPQQSTSALTGSTRSFKGRMELKTDDAPPQKTAILLSGSTNDACLSVVPTLLDFGFVTINCASSKEAVTIYNNCKQDITLSSIKFSRLGTNGFHLVQAPNLPHRLTTGKGVQIEISYKATKVGFAKAVLQVANSAPGQSPLSIPMVAQGIATKEQTDVFKQTGRPKVDILFVIDNSGSMADDQKNLAKNFGTFIKQARKFNADFQIGITTTDITLGNYNVPGGLRGKPGILTNQTPNIEAVFAKTVTVGVGGSDTEMGLEGARLALSPPLTTTGINKGFLRKDAALAIIIVSDEPDQSPFTTAYYLNFFRGVKGFRRPDRLRVHIVVGIDEKTRRSWCPYPGTPTARSRGRYLTISLKTGGVVASICNRWSTTLSRIGGASFAHVSQFHLSRPAIPNTVQVKVNGKVVSQGATTWKFSIESNTVAFKKTLPKNATIEIRYKVLCL